MFTFVKRTFADVMNEYSDKMHRTNSVKIIVLFSFDL